MNFLSICVTLSALLCSFGLCEKDIPRRTCLDITRSKSSPSEEKDLHPVCSHWSGNVCCTKKTSEDIHNNITDFFHLNHYVCKESGLSKSCMEFFQKDACLFECSPDLWEYGNHKDDHGNERVKLVPLCESDCNDWFNACASDLTCTTNWTSTIHKGSKSSKAFNCTKCETIKKKFGSAENFCQLVWDHAYRVVKDNSKCMSLKGNAKTASEPTETTRTDSTSANPSKKDENASHSDADSNKKGNDGKNSVDSGLIKKDNWYVLFTLVICFMSFFNEF